MSLIVNMEKWYINNDLVRKFKHFACCSGGKYGASWSIQKWQRKLQDNIKSDIFKIFPGEVHEVPKSSLVDELGA